MDKFATYIEKVSRLVMRKKESWYEKWQSQKCLGDFCGSGKSKKPDLKEPEVDESQDQQEEPEELDKPALFQGVV